MGVSRFRARRGLAGALTVCAVFTVSSGSGTASIPGRDTAPAAQADALNLGTWQDREISVKYLSSTNETVATLALVPAGPGGSGSSLILVFEGRWPGRERSGQPGVLELRTYHSPLADQRVLRRVDLRFVIDTGTGRPVSLYFFGSNWGPFGYVGAGADIPVVRFALAPSELLALAAAERMTGDAMGFPFVLDHDQIDALVRFSEIVAGSAGSSQP